VHERHAEHTLGLVLIVPEAAPPQALDGGLAAARHGEDVIEREALPGAAAPAALARERALAPIAFPDLSAHMRR